MKEQLAFLTNQLEPTTNKRPNVTETTSDTVIHITFRSCSHQPNFSSIPTSLHSIPIQSNLDTTNLVLPSIPMLQPEMTPFLFSNVSQPLLGKIASQALLVTNKQHVAIVVPKDERNEKHTPKPDCLETFKFLNEKLKSLKIGNGLSEVDPYEVCLVP